MAGPAAGMHDEQASRRRFLQLGGIAGGWLRRDRCWWSRPMRLRQLGTGRPERHQPARPPRLPVAEIEAIIRAMGAVSDGAAAGVFADL